MTAWNGHESLISLVGAAEEAAHKNGGARVNPSHRVGGGAI